MEFNHPVQRELVTMGFAREYVVRSTNLYRKKFKNKPLRLEVLTEIIIRLQQRDRNRFREKRARSMVRSSVASDETLRSAAKSNHEKRRSSMSSFQGMIPISPIHQSLKFNHAALRQSVSYDASDPFNGFGSGQELQEPLNENNNLRMASLNNLYDGNQSEMESNDDDEKSQEKEEIIVRRGSGGSGSDKVDSDHSNRGTVSIEIIMATSSIGAQKCRIQLGKGKSLKELKTLISTCLTDFNCFDESYAFFHDESGFIFDELEMTMNEVLRLMHIDTDGADKISITFRIGRIVSKYIKST